MEATPKTDQIICVLKQATLAVNLIKYWIREIEHAGNDSNKANKMIDFYQSNIEFCRNCEVTAKNIYDEYWRICPNVDELHKYAMIMKARFKNVGIPIWVCTPNSSYQKQINDKIWSMEQQGTITKSQASDIMGLFDLLVGWIGTWMYRIQNIMREMGITPELSPISETNKRPHYHKDDEEKAKKQFENLVNGGYFPSDTPLDDWLYIYGVKGKKPNKSPLDWQKTQKELGYMIRYIWQDTDINKWAICSEVFTIKGRSPNTNVMKSDLSSIDYGYKNKPRTFDKLDELLKV